MNSFRVCVLVLTVVISIPFLVGCGQSSAAPVEDRKTSELVATPSRFAVVTIQDLEAQLTSQMAGREAVEFPEGKTQQYGQIESVRIDRFNKPATPTELSISLDVKIKSEPNGDHVSLGRTVTMYRASPNHWVGTYGIPAGVPINLVLSFASTGDDL